MEGLAVAFVREGLFASISFSIRRESGINFVKTGKINGAALFGVLGNRVDPISKAIAFSGGIHPKCVRRRTYGGPETSICRRLLSMFSHLSSVRARVSTLTRRVSGGSKGLSRLIRERAVLVRRFRETNNLACGDEAHSTLLKLKFSRGSFAVPINGLDNNRHSGLYLTGLLLSRDGVLLLSRPAGRLSVSTVT